jgi:hypothetical protein
VLSWSRSGTVCGGNCHKFPNGRQWGGSAAGILASRARTGEGHASRLRGLQFTFHTLSTLIFTFLGAQDVHPCNLRYIQAHPEHFSPRRLSDYAKTCVKLPPCLKRYRIRRPADPVPTGGASTRWGETPSSPASLRHVAGRLPSAPSRLARCSVIHQSPTYAPPDFKFWSRVVIFGHVGSCPKASSSPLGGSEPCFASFAAWCGPNSRRGELRESQPSQAQRCRRTRVFRPAIPEWPLAVVSERLTTRTR